MQELTYPNIQHTHDWFRVKPSRYCLRRWLLLSLALHLAILMVWELTQLTQIEATLPLQSGQQAVSVQLVSSAASRTQPQQTPVEKSQPIVAAVDTKAEINVAPKPDIHKTVNKTKETSKVAPVNAQDKNDSSAPVSMAANLTQGVYSEASPQSSHKPEYPRMAILKSQQGKVVIKLDIDESGQTHNIQVLSSSGFALLDNAVITFAQVERFIPAVRNNSPVKTTQQYSFLFKLI